jgi:polyisoprenoid-binding protein YceI
MSPDLSVVAPGVYRIDPTESRIDFTTTHWFGLGKVHGSFAITSGDLIVADPIADSSVRAVASTASFSTNNSKRDVQVRGRTFLDTEQHPDLLFASTSVVFEGDSSTVYGHLTVKGRQEQLILSVTGVDTHHGVITANASTRVDRHQHGVGAMPGIAGRHLEIAIHFKARIDR